MGPNGGRVDNDSALINSWMQGMWWADSPRGGSHGRRRGRHQYRTRQTVFHVLRPGGRNLRRGTLSGEGDRQREEEGGIKEEGKIEKGIREESEKRKEKCDKEGGLWDKRRRERERKERGKVKGRKRGNWKKKRGKRKKEVGKVGKERGDRKKREEGKMRKGNRGKREKGKGKGICKRGRAWRIYPRWRKNGYVVGKQLYSDQPNPFYSWLMFKRLLTTSPYILRRCYFLFASDGLKRTSRLSV
jgi:hypothetical protein